MKFKKTKAAALTLAAVIAGASLSGCAFVTTDPAADLAQTVIEVDISKSEDFQANYSKYDSVIKQSGVTKYEMMTYFSNIGPTYMNYGYSAEQVFELIRASLTNRQIFLQYAMVYFFEHGADVYEDGTPRTQSGYESAVSSASAEDKEIAGLRYFLEEDEIKMVEYQVKVGFNQTLDSLETELIEELENHNHDHDHGSSSTTSSRTTPTGVDKEDEDFYDLAYKIYTGANSASDCGTYETVDESTPTTRRKAYKKFLANLNTYHLIGKSENSSDLTSLDYYAYQRRSQYESAIISKLEDCFEKEAQETVTRDWVEKEKYAKTIESQRQTFDASSDALESALDSASDSSYVFYAPNTTEGYGYGYVLNILLPFSTKQSQQLNDAPADLDDFYGNKFATRASILKNISATDQRTAWFDAEYAFEADFGADNPFTGGNANRNYLFFENNLKKSTAAEGEKAQYTPLKNYIGKYTYNGTVLKTEDDDGDVEYAFKPNRISIDGFMDELERYLNFNGLHLDPIEYNNGAGSAYYNRPYSAYYNADGTVDYAKFLYATTHVTELKNNFDVNKIFMNGTDGKTTRSLENTAMSVINELSFAYNTDTAGLNSYLGYAVSPNNTNFVKEFEYAAQAAVRGGAGTITIAPSDYGWHIMYCTFSYAGNPQPYNFNWDEIEVEGTFSNLYYEALKAENFANYSTHCRTTIINSYDNDDCVTLHEKLYKEMFEA